MRYCQSPGCSRPVSGWSLHCNAHKSRARRHGDPQQEGVTKAQLKPYLEVVRRRITKNADTLPGRPWKATGWRSSSTPMQS
jgi:hypothetical protein